MQTRIWSIVAILALGVTAARADEGSLRRAVVVSMVEGGGTTTNQISYNERGLRSSYDITTKAPVGGEIVTKVTFVYDERDQVRQMTSRMQSQFGAEQWDYTYSYDASDPPMLITVSGSSTGSHSTKQFSYDDAGRIIGMNMTLTQADGQVISDTHVLTYDPQGRVSHSSRSFTNSQGTARGGFDLTYGPDDAPIAFTVSEPFGATIEATISRDPQAVITRGTVIPTGSQPLGIETIAEFENGLCRIPKATDGIIVEELFNGSGDFYPADMCRD